MAAATDDYCPGCDPIAEASSANSEALWQRKEFLGNKPLLEQGEADWDEVNRIRRELNERHAGETMMNRPSVASTAALNLRLDRLSGYLGDQGSPTTGDLGASEKAAIRLELERREAKDRLNAAWTTWDSLAQFGAPRELHAETRNHLSGITVGEEDFFLPDGAYRRAWGVRVATRTTTHDQFHRIALKGPFATRGEAILYAEQNRDRPSFWRP